MSPLPPRSSSHNQAITRLPNHLLPQRLWPCTSRTARPPQDPDYQPHHSQGTSFPWHFLLLQNPLLCPRTDLTAPFPLFSFYFSPWALSPAACCPITTPTTSQCRLSRPPPPSSPSPSSSSSSPAPRVPLVLGILPPSLEWKESTVRGPQTSPPFTALTYTGRHGDIEDTLLTLLMARVAGGKKFDKMTIKRVYFGNWLRDYCELPLLC